MDEAAPAALKTVLDYLSADEENSVQLVRFVLYGWQAYQVYRRALARLLESE
jgi:O-acetyl-ADP-ribose deacetylase (regulator of RNase III)